MVLPDTKLTLAVVLGGQTSAGVEMAIWSQRHLLTFLRSQGSVDPKRKRVI
jgi:hypothetical protein